MKNGLSCTTNHGAGPPLLLVHGMFGSRDDWRAVTDLLGEGVSWIAVDLPCHGQSAPIQNEADPVGEVVERLIMTLDHLGVETVVPVGYSMGGRLSLELAIARTDRIAGLVLESAAPGGLQDPKARRERRALDLRRAEEVRRDLSAFLDAWYRAPLFGGLRQRKDVYATMIQRRLAGEPAQLARALTLLSPGSQENRTDELSTLSGQMPVMWLHGLTDAKYSKWAGVLKDVCPQMRVLGVEGVGHSVHLEAPSAFSGLLQDFRRWLAEVW